MKLIFNKNRLTGYNCRSCNGYNDILSLNCIYCKDYSNLSPEIIRQSYAIKLIRTGEHYPMSSNDIIELHAKFFNHEMTMIKDMDTVQMHERRETLRKIVIQAKARLTAHDEEERKRNAERIKEQKQWLLSSSSNDPNVTDAIAAVKERKQRQTKADRNLALLQSLGVADADKLVAAMIKKETGAAISSTASREIKDKREYPLSKACSSNQHHMCNGFRDNENPDKSKPCDCKCHKPKVKFDPSSINLKKG